jgi:cyclohexanone monooxygenase
MHMSDQQRDLDAIVVGAGFGGLYQLKRFREMGLSTRVFEAGDGVGGTWYWNCYPGARCDVESMEYSYGFSSELEQEWKWSERYPPQPEILAYVNHVADRFDLRKDIQFETRVESAIWDEDASRWTVGTSDGATWTARYVVMATGCLSVPKRPEDEFEGTDSFTGDTYLTALWPRDGVDFTGKRVAVIGTGSTAIQTIPQVAKQASQVTVFQRTPNFSVPAQNAPLGEGEVAEMKAKYQAHREAQRRSLFGVPLADPTTSALELSAEEARAELEKRWQYGGAAGFMLAFTDTLVDADANEVVAEFVRDKIRATVKDPVVAEKLCPTTYPIATKRICVDIDYFETYNRDNVTLVDVNETPIVRIVEHGVETSAGVVEVDAIVYAIGFDAMTGAMLSIDIRGRGGKLLKDAWADGPRTYLGLAIAGFPNMFTITGPGSPSVFSNMIVSIEQAVDWIADCVTFMRDNDHAVADATEEAQDRWVAHVAEVANATLFPRANSWYMGANVPGKPRVFSPYLGGLWAYRQKCDEVAANGYEGFAFAKERAAAGVA